MESEITLLDNDILNSLAFSIELRAPHAKRGTIKYMESFGRSIETVEASEMIVALDNTRRNLESKLEGNIVLDEAEEALNQYLPNLFLITWSLKSQPSVSIYKPTIFEWRGSLTTDENHSKFQVFAFEVAMSLHTLVVLFLYCL
jgi:hypothetical protein